MHKTSVMFMILKWGRGSQEVGEMDRALIINKQKNGIWN
jgi:hypothetical protein